MNARPPAKPRTKPRAQSRAQRRPAASARRRKPTAAERRRKQARVRRAWLISTLVALPLLAFGGFSLLIVFAVNAFSTSFNDDSFAFESAPSIEAPPNVAGYGVEQLGNACTIIAAGSDLGFDGRDQTIAVMTAMGESSLRNIDYGDWETSGVTNPDGSRTTSIGLFQQQDNWGSRDERLDPYAAATLFYRAMAARVPDREGIDPTMIAHRTQINLDANHYARYWDAATRVTAALGGSPADGDSLDGIPACAA
ncbi:hypothetical protein FHX48_001918 [Microbacterium halimionae]|uniref:Peptidase M23 n=1 Tax=Microbacterium halimionae TaxID=1526413 RepID=A0A7W3PLR0_9MICO|nr:peptidase M23 [Microbacterium halimionae]MBA8816825.1 hypothetical protein [Microbacterium halimionae]NII94879.1 hypothetical protein [Microbacterium halimionae]